MIARNLPFCMSEQVSLFADRVTDCSAFILQEQIDAIGLNLSMFDQTHVPVSDPNDSLADQMLNVTKATEEYDPEELYDPTEGI